MSLSLMKSEGTPIVVPKLSTGEIGAAGAKPSHWVMSLPVELHTPQKVHLVKGGAPVMFAVSACSQ